MRRLFVCQLPENYAESLFRSIYGRSTSHQKSSLYSRSALSNCFAAWFIILARRLPSAPGHSTSGIWGSARSGLGALPTFGESAPKQFTDAKRPRRDRLIAAIRHVRFRVRHPIKPAMAKFGSSQILPRSAFELDRSGGMVRKAGCEPHRISFFAGRCSSTPNISVSPSNVLRHRVPPRRAS